VGLRLLHQPPLPEPFGVPLMVFVDPMGPHGPLPATPGEGGLVALTR
jgi:hypothetical protein